mmetsp:Transcript_7615/g.28716  ORF Transcript_7615/g.28716 Transcript_7615/m.28716 type:complete len:234 (+) Transcript_7615:417-1118(+)
MVSAVALHVGARKPPPKPKLVKVGVPSWSICVFSVAPAPAKKPGRSEPPGCWPRQRSAPMVGPLTTSRSSSVAYLVPVYCMPTLPLDCKGFPISWRLSSTCKVKRSASLLRSEASTRIRPSVCTSRPSKLTPVTSSPLPMPRTFWSANDVRRRARNGALEPSADDTAADSASSALGTSHCACHEKLSELCAEIFTDFFKMYASFRKPSTLLLKSWKNIWPAGQQSKVVGTHCC